MPIRWKLKELATRRKLTGNDIAELTGISRQTIYKLMRQPEAPRIDTATLETLSANLKVGIGSLLEYVPDE